MQAERVQAFAGKMFGVLNGAMLALMTSIGRQTGLFETMATLPPSSSDEIARATGLNERYVREWLGALVTGGIIAYDQQAGTYVLPQEHGRFSPMPQDHETWHAIPSSCPCWQTSRPR